MEETAGLHTRRPITDKDLTRINLGKLFWKSTVDGIQDETVRNLVSRYCKNIVEMIKSGSGLVIDGAPGVGKTSAAAVILKEALRRRFDAYFVTHDELRDLQFNDKVFGSGADGVMVSYKLRTTNLLVLDNFNDPSLMDKVFGPVHLERMLTKRNGDRKTTILTTRVGSKFKSSEMTSLFDAVSQTMMPLRIDGKNLRDNARSELRARILGED